MRRKWLKLGFVLAATLTLIFVMRAALFAVFWMDPHRDRHPVKPWMTPRYIVRTYDIPREVLAETLNLKAGDSPKKPLGALARERGVAAAQMVGAVQALVDAHPGPPPDSLPGGLPGGAPPSPPPPPSPPQQDPGKP
tara:strand:+ start:469 stop:879 length:411 start_codon:yes stop_codon:yes gene_type:complete